MTFKNLSIFIIFFVLLNFANGVTRKNAPCTKPKFHTKEKTYAFMYGRLWYQYLLTDTIPEQKCMINVFSIDHKKKGYTSIYKSYENTTNGKLYQQFGTLNFSNNALLVHMPPYPLNGDYYLIDVGTAAATFYLCYPDPTDSKFVLQVGMTFASDLSKGRKIMKRAKRYLKIAGLNVQQLKKAYSKKCKNYQLPFPAN